VLDPGRFRGIECRDEAGRVADDSAAVLTGVVATREHGLKIEGEFVRSRFYPGPLVPQRGGVIMGCAVGGSQHKYPSTSFRTFVVPALAGPSEPPEGGTASELMIAHLLRPTLPMEGVRSLKVQSSPENELPGGIRCTRRRLNFERPDPDPLPALIRPPTR